jgi:LPS-assembly lipoprotein
MRRSTASLLVWLLLAATAAGCGFKPRGVVNLPFQSLYVAAPDYSSFGADLKRYLESGARSKLVDRPDQAQAVLETLSEQEERQILSLSSVGKVQEYLLRYRVSYRVRDRANRDLIPPSEIQLQRALTWNDSFTLAKTNEEVLLFRDMKDDAIQQITRRLEGVRVASNT